jgi:hypothetical protein
MKTGKCSETLKNRLWKNANVTTQYMIPIADAHKAYAKYIENNINRTILIIHDDFLRELNARRIYQAAVLYDLLIHLTDCASEVSKNMERAFPRSGYRVFGPRAEEILDDASLKAYQLIFHSQYIEGERYPAPLRTSEIPKKLPRGGEPKKGTVEELRHYLWGKTMSRGYVKWGVPAPKMSDVAESKEMVKSTIDDILKLLDGSKKALGKTDYPMAAMMYTEAYHLLKAITDTVNSIRRNFGEEILEIETIFSNTANYECDQIHDMLG